MKDYGPEEDVVWTMPGSGSGDFSSGPVDTNVASGPDYEREGEGPELEPDDELLASVDSAAATAMEEPFAAPSYAGYGGAGMRSSDWVSAGMGDDNRLQLEIQHWSVPWSDLMMVMFVMFAVITATQLSQPNEEPQAQEDVVTRDRVVRPFGDPIMTINVMERAQRVVRESEAQDVDIVLMEDQSVKVSVQGPMLFNAGSAELRSEVTDFLDRLASIIQETPYMIEIVGHTDDVPVSTPVFPSNWELSTARASRVARYLIQSGRIAPSRFTVIGRAQYEPVDGNETTLERSRNRRVEILITRDVLPSSEVAVHE
jgi:chemotaxis protein MotB